MTNRDTITTRYKYFMATLLRSARFGFGMLAILFSVLFPELTRANGNGCGSFPSAITTVTQPNNPGPCSNSGTITFEVTSSGSISSANEGFNNNGTITTFTNAGSIYGSNYGISNNLGGTIDLLINTGSITGGTGIYNAGTIITINNKQGASSSVLTYTGTLPVNYNVIVATTTDYGKLSASSIINASSTNGITFGVDNTSLLTSYRYTSVLSGLTSSNIESASLSGTYGEFSWSLVNALGSSTIWDLLVTSNSGGGGNSPVIPTDITAGTSVGLSSIGVTFNPVFAGGSLVLVSGDQSNQAFSVKSAGGTIVSPASGSATLAGVFSGVGSLTFSGTGTTVFSGVNTYSGGTTVAMGTLSIQGPSATGMGDVYVASGAQLRGTGTIVGALTVAGSLKPGNSPGYLATNASVTMNNGSIYLQDIAGTLQASVNSSSGAAGFYSYLNINSGQFVIRPGTTLTAQLSNLFTPAESGYGSSIYVPQLGDAFRIITAQSGINGRFDLLTQPAELAAGTQLIAFYNMNSSNSVDLMAVPTSYVNTLSPANQNASGTASVLDRLVRLNQSGNATATQEQLLYVAAGQRANNLQSFTTSLAGEVHAASVAVLPQTTLRVQESVIARLGDYSNPARVRFSNSTGEDGKAWADMAYQRADRSRNSSGSGYHSNLYQAVFGSDVYSERGTGIKVGAGVSLSNTVLSASGGNSSVQQGALFLYGKVPVLEDYVIDGIASFGLSSADLSRSDITGLSGGFSNKAVMGNDLLASLGLSRGFVSDDIVWTPFARITYQQVNQSSYNEGNGVAALDVGRFNGNGIHGVLGIAVGSLSKDPLRDAYTYRANVAIGVDSQGLLNPTLNTTLAGLSTTVTTPNAGVAFMQVGLYGTRKISDSLYAFAGVSGEFRNGQTLYGGNLGLKLQF
jgi:autotransporter-associated beta strand protein